MLRRQTNDRRRAIVLVVVLSLLGLFAIVGVTFVMYADKQAMASYHWRQARWFNFTGGTGGGGGPGGPPTAPPDVPKDLLFRWAVGELIYDVPDDATGYYSAIRGHSLARNMYGYNWQTLNTVPFGGRGKIPYDSLVSSGGTPMRNDFLINHVQFPGTPLRYPERIGSNGDGSIVGGEPGTYLLEGGAGYTFPDHNHLFLGATRADGLVLARTFHRPEIFGDLAPGNPNWTNAEGKYLTLRYRPIDMSPTFPFPADAGGDVKNRVGAPGGNDSVWLDLGFPVQTSEAGRKFKPLFAFYVEELDSKINYNIHGNRMVAGATPTHGSNQGWGRWEVNPQKILNGTPTEWYQLFNGEPSPGTQRGRYGVGGNPHDGASAAPGGKRPSVMARVDYNGARESTGTDQYSFALARTANPLNPFPLFPANRYGDGTNEVANHARLYDYFSPLVIPPTPPSTLHPESDYALPVGDLHHLHYSGFTGIDYRNSQVYRLLTTNLDDPTVSGSTTQGVRRRNLLTPLSMQVNRPSIEPMFWNRFASDYAVDTNAPESAPVGSAQPYVRDVNRLRNPPVDGDFHPSWRDWRAQRDVLEKLNLDKELPVYPHQATNAPYHAVHSDTAAVQAATAARQKMAEGIYRRLLFVTGARQPARLDAPTTAEMAPLRYLAQLAVNIVDYIDEDEINTPFLFYPVAIKFFDPTATPPATLAATTTDLPSGDKLPTYWVFGTELPQVVLNEVLVNYKYNTDPDTRLPVVGPFKVRVWAELFSPMPTGVPTGVQAGVDTVTKYPLSWPSNTGFSAYQLVLAGSAAGKNPINVSPENALGVPDEIRKVVDFPTAANARVRTVGNNAQNTVPQIDPLGYFLVGPNDDETGVDATITTPRALAATPWHQSADMSYGVNLTNPVLPTWTFNNNEVLDKNGVTVVLRRLANPHLPPNPDQTSPLYNPYVTVDYLEGGNGTTNVPRDATSPTATYHSWGKQTVYRSRNTTVTDQFVFGANPQPAIRHTLANRNAHSSGGSIVQATGGAWLVHLDRQLSSVFELLEVHARAPWKLTHFFTGDPNGPANAVDHRVAWRDEGMPVPPAPGPGQPPPPKKSHRLYRLFEMIDVGERSAGTSLHGRVPGRVNFNGAWDPEPFLAVADAGPANFFIDGEVDTLRGLFTTRRGLPYPLTIPLNYPAPRPVRSFGAAHTSDLDGVQATYLGNDDPTNNRPLFQLSADNVRETLYQRNELLTKMGNTMTTRSNVFAVWLTVGFFEVTDDTTQPVKLGAEIGAPSTNIRHRFFSIVDRSALTISPAVTTSFNNPNDPNDPAGQVTQAQVFRPDTWVTMAPRSPAIVLKFPDQTAPVSMCIGTIQYAGTPTPLPVYISKGSLLVMDSGATQETVMVDEVDPANNRFRAVFMRPHSQGFRITMPGNPGPQPGFDPLNTVYRDVVPVHVEIP